MVVFKYILNLNFFFYLLFYFILRFSNFAMYFCHCSSFFLFNFSLKLANISVILVVFIYCYTNNTFNCITIFHSSRVLYI